MVCKLLDIRKHETAEEAIKENGEAPEFFRISAGDCPQEFNIDFFQRGGKWCVGVSSKDEKEEREVCLV